jgi:hypothetical protein
MDPFRDPMMRELMRQARHTQELLNNPAIKAAREFQQNHGYLFDNWNRTMNSPEFQMLRDSRERSRPFGAFIPSPAFNAARDFLMQNDVARHIINSSEWRAMIDAQRHHRDLLANTNLTTARAFFEVKHFIDNNIYFGYFGQSFAAEIFDTLSRIEEPTDEKSLQNFIASLESLLSLVIRFCKELGTNPTTYWAMVKFTFAIFVFLYPLYEGQQTEERVIDSVRKAQTQILEEVEKLKPPKVNEIYYVVERKVELKIRPQSKSATIQILSPNQTIKLIQAKGKWIYVEYFDYIEGLPKTGWVLKKYTRRLQGVAVSAGRVKEFQAQMWDEQIERDVKDGRLDALLEQADRDFDSGRCELL